MDLINGEELGSTIYMAQSIAAFPAKNNATDPKQRTSTRRITFAAVNEGRGDIARTRSLRGARKPTSLPQSRTQVRRTSKASLKVLLWYGRAPPDGHPATERLLRNVACDNYSSVSD